jgi:spore coat polysaccharide biosynthesis protein SpsF (cytidylyltransferase family)
MPRIVIDSVDNGYIIKYQSNKNDKITLYDNVYVATTIENITDILYKIKLSNDLNAISGKNNNKDEIPF